MADLRRRGREPPAGPPEVRFTPGPANEIMRDLVPLLAEEGIDVDNIDVPDIETLQRAMNRAVERRKSRAVQPRREGPRRGHEQRHAAQELLARGIVREHVVH